MRSGASKARSGSEAARKAAGLCDHLQGRTDRPTGLQKRASCNGGNLIMVRTTDKNPTDMPAMSRGVATCRMAEACGRSDRRSVTMPETGLLGGASPAPNPTQGCGWHVERQGKVPVVSRARLRIPSESRAAPNPPSGTRRTAWPEP